MNKIELMDYIIDNGGATVDPVTREHVKADAWAVGIGKELYARTQSPEDFKRVLYEVTSEVVKMNADHNQYNPGTPDRYTVGAWIDDNKPGIIVLEPVELIKGTATAIYWGLKYHQTAIYHLKRHEVVNLYHVRQAVKRYA
jgi:hypothetical protein